MVNGLYHGRFARMGTDGLRSLGHAWKDEVMRGLSAVVGKIRGLLENSRNIIP
jgi:hypothetical protein